MAESHVFQAEIKQLLNILIHSLYKDREIFLRELVSNASDALNRIQFEMLTNQDILDPEAELYVHITADEEAKTITITDSGIGMTADEMVDSLGVIARSGAKSFLESLGENGGSAITTDIIGQFGVGFYSVFMVAERVEVTSRSYHPDAEAATWISSGEEGYEILPADKQTRGTEIVIYLREDAAEFATEHRLRGIIKRHSDYVNFPIYVGEPKYNEEGEVVEPLRAANQQTALWRRSSNEVEDEEYGGFYQALTLDFDPPALRIHTRADAPLQFYALLFFPQSTERNIFSPRREAGLKLYARKILIQEYTTDLLPEYLQFVQGVVDSEDLPLNVSRETIQDNPLVRKLKQVITKRVLNELAALAENDPERYAGLWEAHGPYLKHGAITEFGDRESLIPLLRFQTSRSDGALVSLAEYVARMAEGQEAIYFLSADDIASAGRSPHLGPFTERGLEVLYLTAPVDGFLMDALVNYEGHDFLSIDSAELDLENVGVPVADAEEAEALPEEALDQLVSYMKDILGDQVEAVRVSKVLSSGSPARLVAPKGSLDRHQQRLYEMLDKEYEMPTRILEINPHHPIIHNLSGRLAQGWDGQTLSQVVSLVYQSALLADGIHPDPGQMVGEVQALLERVTRLE